MRNISEAFFSFVVMIFSVIDVETTGGSPKHSKVTEIAIYKHNGEKIIDEFVSLVNPEILIPDFVSNLTGITNEMVQNAPKFYEIAKKIIEFTQDTIFVAHNVNFDYSVIRSEYSNLGFDFRLPHLCTVKTARHFIPNEASYSLGKLTKSLGIQLIGRHRAGGDALATAKLLGIILKNSNHDLTKYIQQELNPMLLNPTLNLDEIDAIPNKAGIYKFYNETNQLIYLNKSSAVRNSIERHLRSISKNKKTNWIAEITRIEFELTGIELIAEVVDYQIKKNKIPIYNTKQKQTIEKNLFDDQLNEFDFNGESFYLIGKGRTKQERSIILIDRGSFAGYGYAPFHFNRLSPIFWKRFITHTHNSDDKIQRVIFNYIKKNKVEKIMF